MKRRNNKNTAIDSWIFLDGPPQNAPRNPLVKYYVSWQSCLKRRRHLRPLSTLFLTLNHLTAAKWKHMLAFRSVYIWRILSIPLSPPSGLVSEHEQISRPKLRMRYRISMIYGHPVMAATRALRFSDHVTKRNGGSGDENGATPGHNVLYMCSDVFKEMSRFPLPSSGQRLRCLSITVDTTSFDQHKLYYCTISRSRCEISDDVIVLIWDFLRDMYGHKDTNTINNSFLSEKSRIKFNCFFPCVKG